MSEVAKCNRVLDSVMLPALRLENATLARVAATMETELLKKGIRYRVIVDSKISDKTVPIFLISDATAYYWASGVATAFRCSCTTIDGNSVLFVENSEKK